MRILVTGATGFVGKALVESLSDDPSFGVRAVARRQISDPSDGIECVRVGSLGPETEWWEAVSGMNVVVHTAARVHVSRENSEYAIDEFRRVNVGGTVCLARQAAAVGVRRFIFLSSIKVNGERTVTDQPFQVSDTPNPIDPYSISKYEAERELWDIQASTGMEVTVIRPPLVYGPGVRANFLTMMRYLHRGIPLPLGAIENKRSLVAVDNLVDLMKICCVDERAAGNVWLVADGEDLSTTELLKQLGYALGRPARLFRVPTRVLEVAASVVGRQALARRLLGSLQVDIQRTRDVLGWSPVVTVDNALQQTARDFLGAL